MSNIVERAKQFALEHHKGQVHGPRPFWHHLRDVVNVLKEFGVKDADLLAAAWLHDVVEDTSVTITKVKTEFGDRVGVLVDALTDGPGKTRAEKKAKPYRMLPTIPGATTVKVADRIANVRFSHKQHAQRYLTCYKTEHPGFLKALRVQDELKEMWHHLDSLLTD